MDNPVAFENENEFDNPLSLTARTKGGGFHWMGTGMDPGTGARCSIPIYRVGMID